MMKNEGGNKKITPFNSGTVYLMENLQASKNNSKIISKTSTNPLNLGDEGFANNGKKNKK